ncbi:RNA-binding domain-containing protein, partial [Basidiobolus meristosporus CBS 931.73]
NQLAICSVVKEIQRINLQEASRDIDGSGSWHSQYKDSAYLFVGGLPFELTEGDIICIFSQYGEILDVNLVRDKKTGKSKGFCFLGYSDQRSTILAVDNLNGIKVLERTLRVDHVANYKPPKEGDEPDAPRKFEYNAAPPLLEASSSSDSSPENVDEEDPMADYIRKRKARKEKKKAKKARKEDKEKKSKKKKEDKESKDEKKVGEAPSKREPSLERKEERYRDDSRTRSDRRDSSRRESYSREEGDRRREHRHHHREESEYRSKDAKYEESSSRYRDYRSERRY